MTVGIFFYTKHQYNWPMRYNLMLAAVQGIFYGAGALSAHSVTRVSGRRNALIGVYFSLAILLALTALRPTPQITPFVLCLYQLASACAWPIVESLVSGRSSGRELSRRLGLYNFNWSFTGAIVIAASGLVIEHFPRGVFLIPAAAHLLCALILMASPHIEEDTEAAKSSSPTHAASALLSQRRLALWLSRIALPATYVVIYSLSATLPSLPVLSQMSPAMGTLVGSAWLWVRTASFVALGITAWWHTRPRLLLWAAILMLIAFPAGLLPAAFSTSSQALAMLLLGQVAMGVGMGIVYTASLYFGMVLSQGSTEHSGYHEALIGLGQLVGPGSGALAQILWPGNALPGILAVTAVLALCAAGGCAASLRARGD